MYGYFYYDSLLRRYALEDSDGLRYFTWDNSGTKLLDERDISGNVTAYYTHGYSYVPGIGTMVAAKKQESSATYYQFPSMDHRGSVYRLTDENNEVVAAYEYNAFGEPLQNQEDGATNRMHYQSNWITLKDSGDEIILSPSRLYSTATGQFLQKDFLFQMTLLKQKGMYLNSIFRGRQRSFFGVDNYGLYRAFGQNPSTYTDFMGEEKSYHQVKNSSYIASFSMENKENVVKDKKKTYFGGPIYFELNLKKELQCGHLEVKQKVSSLEERFGYLTVYHGKTEQDLYIYDASPYEEQMKKYNDRTKAMKDEGKLVPGAVDIKGNKAIWYDQIGVDISNEIKFPVKYTHYLKTRIYHVCNNKRKLIYEINWSFTLSYEKGKATSTYEMLGSSNQGTGYYDVKSNYIDLFKDLYGKDKVFYNIHDRYNPTYEK